MTWSPGAHISPAPQSIPIEELSLSRIAEKLNYVFAMTHELREKLYSNRFDSLDRDGLLAAQAQLTQVSHCLIDEIACLGRLIEISPSRRELAKIKKEFQDYRELVKDRERARKRRARKKSLSLKRSNEKTLTKTKTSSTKTALKKEGPCSAHQLNQ